MSYRPVTFTSPRPFETVLTIHQDDIYPVPAFRIPEDGKDAWLLETEGPEDTLDGRPDKFRPLYRPPTHWMPLPESPTPVAVLGATERSRA